jgi:hypothetical protein
MAAGKGLIIVALSFSGILLYIARRSMWRGLKLIAALFFVHFGISVLLTHLESYIFLTQLISILPKGSLPVLVLDNSLSAALFSPLVAIIAGKLKGPEEKTGSNRLNLQPVEWVLKMTSLGILYYFVYTQFGSHVMIPLAGHEAFKAYYHGLHMPAWMPFFQFCRGLVWVGLALPVIKMFNGGKIETAIAIGLLFSILMGFLLLIPSPIMPDKIRIAHFVEVITSNFTFGFLATCVLLLKMNRPFPTRKPISN